MGNIFSGHVRVNQWSDFFWRGSIFSRHRSWNIWWWFCKLRWSHNTCFSLFLMSCSSPDWNLTARCSMVDLGRALARLTAFAISQKSMWVDWFKCGLVMLMPQVEAKLDSSPDLLYHSLVHEHACKFLWMIGCFHMIPNLGLTPKSVLAPEFRLILDLWTVFCCWFQWQSMLATVSWAPPFPHYSCTGCIKFQLEMWAGEQLCVDSSVDVHRFVMGRFVQCRRAWKSFFNGCISLFLAIKLT